MKLELEFSEEEIKQLYLLVEKWKEMFPYPLTHLEGLRKVEDEIASQFKYKILASSLLPDLSNQINTEKK